MAETPPFASSLVDLPGMLQHIASQRRSGVLLVGQGSDQRRLRCVAGNLVAISGGGDASFLKAVGWACVAKAEELARFLTWVGPDTRPEIAAKALLDAGLVNADALLDCIDCYVEEEFAILIAWKDPPLSFAPDAGGDAWADFQQQRGVSLAPGGIILEALRRQDELSSISAQVPERYDCLVPDPAVSVPSDLGPDATLLLKDLGETKPAIVALDHPRLPPFRAIHALVSLLRLGVVRIGTPSEVVVKADAAYAQGDDASAFGLYQRALALGQDSARIHLHLAELCERNGRLGEAAAAFLRAAPGLNDAGARVVALRSALRLGADREAPLRELARIYRDNGEREDAVSALFELAEVTERKGVLDQAQQAIAEAQELGGDAVRSALVLARLAAAGGDRGEAALQLELAARSAEAAGRRDEAIKAWLALYDADPRRADFALPAARLLVAAARPGEALAVLRGLLRSRPVGGEELLIEVHRLITSLDANDVAAHDWLAQTFQRRKDRDGAIAQLKQAVAAQERSGDHRGQMRSLESVLELDPQAFDALLQVGELRLQMGQDNLAATRFAQASDILLERGDLVRARYVLDQALSKLPASLALRSRLAQAVSRIGDRAEAARQHRLAADLAAGIGHTPAAREHLVQLCRLRPDDLAARVQLARLLDQHEGPERDLVLRDVVRCAMRTANHGIAADHARRRVALAPGIAYDARSELVALLNRMGDEAGELSEGRKLLDDLLERGEVERASELLQRLVASQPRNGGLVLQLAELYEALGEARPAARFFRHALPLLQVEDRLDDARRCLAQLRLLGDAGDAPVLDLAQKRLDQGIAVDFDKIRQELEHDQRRKVAEQIGSGELHRSVAAGTTTRARPGVRRTSDAASG